MLPVWIAQGTIPYAELGYSVRSAGDVDGDGTTDVVIGAPSSTVLTGDPGSASVHFGTPIGPGAPVTVVGAFAFGELGFTVDGAGDVNGDGFDDVIVGAPVHDGFGWVGVFHGSALGIDPIAPAWDATSDQVDARFGAAVAAAGDVDGDGYDDVLVAAHSWLNADDPPGEPTGRVWLYLGSSAGLSPTAAWTADGDLPSDCCFGTWGSYGASLAAGDLDGDGYDDVVIGSHEDLLHVYPGGPAGPPAAPTWVAAARTGSVLDVNGDGYDDLVALDDADDQDNGAAQLYLGSAAGLAPAPVWSVLESVFESSFTAAAGADLDGDGYEDLILGLSAWEDPASPAQNTGLVVVYLGSALGPAAVPVCEAQGEQDYAKLGHDVADAGDLDGDGIDDLLVGAPYEDGGGTSVGRAYAFGAATCVDADRDGIRDDLDLCFGADASLDLDGDGFCALAVSGATEDCDDGDPLSFPGADELCDGVDNGCAGGLATDERDADADGLMPCAGDCDDADAAVRDGAVELCDGRDNVCAGEVPPDEQDADADGYRICDGDCNDWYPDDHPGAAEQCDGYDNDCSGALPPDEADGDGDGVSACAGDCDDAAPDRFPGAPELCDGVDNGCVGVLGPDEADGDSDGALGCADCDDADPTTFPGAAEQCDGRANDCTGEVPPGETDVDGDGRLPCGGDCDDLDAAASPDAVEVCGDQVDNDCDRVVDEGCAKATSPEGSGCDTSGLGGGLGMSAVWIALVVRRRAAAALLACAASPAVASEAPIPPLTPLWQTASGTYPAQFGASVAGVPDADGDGFDEVIGGAPQANPDGVAVTFHGPLLAPAWTHAHGSFDFPGDSIYAFREFGATVVGADLNGDGLGEWGVAGAGWVGVYARSPSGVDVLVADFGCGDSNFYYVTADTFGTSLAAGDLDGDGFEELVVGAPAGHYPCLYWDPAVFVYRGAAEAMSETPAWQLELDLGGSESLFGHSVAVGDVNADGYGDVIVGAPGASTLAVFHGSPAGPSGAPATSSVMGAGLGWAVAALGDVDADGFDDVAVLTSPGVASRVDVYHGSRLGLAALPATTIPSPQASSDFGASVAGAGDVNADGYTDLVVGAPLHDGMVDNEGQALLYLGSPIGIVPVAAWTAVGGTPLALFGTSVAGGVDVNADGFADVIVGAPLGDGLTEDEGSVYVYAGGPAPTPVLEEDTPCTDADDDGISTCSGDCDDGDRTTFPGADELCDGRDNVCAGAVPPGERDADADGAAPCAGDCDDTTSSAGPGVQEICGDLADNDCDGASDEDCHEEPAESGCGCAGAPAGGGPASLALVALATGIRRIRGVARVTP